MHIAEEIEMLEVPVEIGERRDVIFPTLLREKERVILVDAGYPGQLSQIGAAIQNAGASLECLKQVIVTHQDIDHIGGLAALRQELTQPFEIYAHEIEKPYIQGDLQPVKLAQLEAKRDALTAQQQVFYERLKVGFQHCCVTIDRTLEDGEVLPYCGGIRVIHTPGHTPGHICLYLQAYKTLVAGDALQMVDGKLAGPSEMYSADVAQARKSLNKFADFAIENVICYHGGVYRDPHTNRQITALAH